MISKKLQGSIELREWRKKFNPSKFKQEDEQYVLLQKSIDTKKRNKTPSFSL
ncbi:hypothetical protein [Photobacterium damselae]|uniref:hypothetical protein n=1 Tax=Photobacterium damselae TaxID=38293 RepID=UPI0013A598C2|nr:hypothetical protein [Photobacterium damselae]